MLKNVLDTMSGERDDVLIAAAIHIYAAMHSSETHSIEKDSLRRGIINPICPGDELVAVRRAIDFMNALERVQMDTGTKLFSISKGVNNASAQG
jgi:hypothetical protein